MLKKILIVLALVVIVLVGVVAVQPSDFRITRSITIDAPALVVFSQVNNFHNWEAWSPWAKLDPKAKTAYEGAASGVGAIFAWDGNKDVGAGRQTIVESRPRELIRIKLEFLRPFKAVSTAEFTFTSKGGQTVVAWSMFGKNNFIGKAMSLVMNCDDMVGRQFQKGLADLKSQLEWKRTIE